MDKKVTMLMILDGFGINENTQANAVTLANTPNIDKLMKTCPTTKMYTSGLNVGLPDGQMGNSEVGHTNIGAGRIVYQELTRITKEIQDGDFYKNEELKKENYRLKNYIEKTFEVVKNLFNFPIDRFKRLVNNFVQYFEK